jgi:hypothetical protein
MARRRRPKTAATKVQSPPMSTAARREGLLEELCDETVWLGQCWRLYRQTYGDRAHVQTMRDAAPFFFGVAQRLFQEGLFLSVHRLIDRAGSHDDQTASLESLIQTIDAPEDAVLGRRLRRELKELRRSCADLIDWRHREIAHRDLQTVLLMKAPPNPVLVRTVKNALEVIAQILTDVGRHYGHPVVIEHGDEDGDTLMWLLQLGQEHRPEWTLPR